MTQAMFTQAAKAKRLPIFGGDIFLTMPVPERGTSVSLFEDVRRPGDGPPLHIHRREDEIFRIIEGRFKLRLGEQTLEASAGDTIFLPRDVPHSFINSGETTGRLLVVVQPGGVENFFFDVARENLRVPQDVERLAQVAAGYGLEFIGPNPFFD